MANHVRTQIRDQVLFLIGNLETTETNVFANRVYPVDQLPCIIVYNGDEQSEQDIIGAREFNRLFELKIECYAQDDDTLDQIAKEVEAALDDQTLGGLTKDFMLVSTLFQFADGENPAGSATMTYLANYRTLINAPDVAL